MIMTSLGLNWGPLVHTIFVILLYVLNILLLVFLCLKFLHQQESGPKLVDSLQSFGAQIEYFPSKFQNYFYSYSLTLRSQRLQPLWFSL